MLQGVKQLSLVSIVVIGFLLTGCLGILGAQPNFKISGVEDGKTYYAPVTIVVEADKGTTIEGIALNGESIENNTEVTVSGEYELEVIGVNKSGKEKIEELSFILNIEVPIISISGAENGGYYTEPVTPVITSDGSEDIIVATLNSEEYVLGTPISEHGSYTLKVTATNPADKSWTVTIEFELGVPWEYTFGISEELHGFTTSQGATLAYDDTFIRDGQEKAQNIKVTLSTTKEYGGVVIYKGSDSNAHEDWLSDLSPYQKLTAWVYIDKFEDMPPSKGISLKIWASSKGAVSKQIDKADLNEGWNYIEYDIADLMKDRLDELTEFDSHIEFVVNKIGKETLMSFYISDIKFVKTQ